MSDADVALACMEAFVDGLFAAGVREACVSPGSRSTPLALALARHPSVRVRVHLDERSSAFFALGVSKATAAPVAVACTSGTAAANLLPAVIEGSMGRVPLVVLTADRPPELRGVGANQTIDQLGLYGGYVRSSVEAPIPNESPSLDEWRRRGSDAAAAASVAPPRPVHVNLPFREPLVPGEDGTDVSRRLDAGSIEPSDARPAGIGPLVHDVSKVGRGLVYAGGLRVRGDDVVAIAEALGWPLVAEPHSGARHGSALAGGRLLLESDLFVRSFTPDVVLQIGAAPTSRAGLALVRRARRLLVLDPDDSVADPLRRAALRSIAEPRDVRDALAGLERVAIREWVDAWADASERARSAADSLLDRWDEPFEGRIARDVAAALPGGADLCVGSSMPIRDLDLYMRPRDGIRIFANRGASGIDGFVSTTLGVAESGAPTVGLLGDLTLLHDIGALVWNARRGPNATLVVLDNGGGAIFASLEQRALPELEEFFVTPHGADIGAIARSMGAAHHAIERADELEPALRSALDTGGIQLLHVRIDPERDRRRRAEIRAVIQAAVA